MLHEHIVHIADLAKLDPEPATLDRFGRQCMHILGYIEVLGEVDTAQVEPLYSPLAQDEALRADAADASDQRAAMLANASETDGAFFVVPRIV